MSEENKDSSGADNEENKTSSSNSNNNVHIKERTEKKYVLSLDSEKSVSSLSEDILAVETQTEDNIMSESCISPTPNAYGSGELIVPSSPFADLEDEKIQISSSNSTFQEWQNMPGLLGEGTSSNSQAAAVNVNSQHLDLHLSETQMTDKPEKGAMDGESSSVEIVSQPKIPFFDLSKDQSQQQLLLPDEMESQQTDMTMDTSISLSQNATQIENTAKQPAPYKVGEGLTLDSQTQESNGSTASFVLERPRLDSIARTLTDGSEASDVFRRAKQAGLQADNRDAPIQVDSSTTKSLPSSEGNTQNSSINQNSSWPPDSHMEDAIMTAADPPLARSTSSSIEPSEQNDSPPLQDTLADRGICQQNTMEDDPYSSLDSQEDTQLPPDKTSNNEGAATVKTPEAMEPPLASSSGERPNVRTLPSRVPSSRISNIKPVTTYSHPAAEPSSRRSSTTNQRIISDESSSSGSFSASSLKSSSIRSSTGSGHLADISSFSKSSDRTSTGTRPSLPTGSSVSSYSPRSSPQRSSQGLSVDIQSNSDSQRMDQRPNGDDHEFLLPQNPTQKRSRMSEMEVEPMVTGHASLIQDTGRLSSHTGTLSAGDRIIQEALKDPNHLLNIPFKPLKADTSSSSVHSSRSTSKSSSSMAHTITLFTSSDDLNPQQKADTTDVSMDGARSATHSVPISESSGMTDAFCPPSPVHLESDFPDPLRDTSSDTSPSRHVSFWSTPKSTRAKEPVPPSRLDDIGGGGGGDVIQSKPLVEGDPGRGGEEHDDTFIGDSEGEDEIVTESLLPDVERITRQVDAGESPDIPVIKARPKKVIAAKFDEYVEGCIVFARWTDGNYYPGHIRSIIETISGKKRFMVSYDDGTALDSVEEEMFPISILKTGVEVYADRGVSLEMGKIVQITGPQKSRNYKVEFDDGESKRFKRIQLSFSEELKNSLIRDYTGSTFNNPVKRKLQLVPSQPSSPAKSPKKTAASKATPKQIRADKTIAHKTDDGNGKVDPFKSPVVVLKRTPVDNKKGSKSTGASGDKPSKITDDSGFADITTDAEKTPAKHLDPSEPQGPKSTPADASKLVPGASVFGRWTDNYFYHGSIVTCSQRGGRYQIDFDDGTKLSVTKGGVIPACVLNTGTKVLAKRNISPETSPNTQNSPGEPFNELATIVECLEDNQKCEVEFFDGKKQMCSVNDIVLNESQAEFLRRSSSALDFITPVKPGKLEKKSSKSQQATPSTASSKSTTKSLLSLTKSSSKSSKKKAPKSSSKSQADTAMSASKSEAEEAKSSSNTKADGTKSASKSKADRVKSSSKSEADGAKSASKSKADGVKSASKLQVDEAKSASKSKAEEARSSTKSKTDEDKSSSKSKADDAKKSAEEAPQKADIKKGSTKKTKTPARTVAATGGSKSEKKGSKADTSTPLPSSKEPPTDRVGVFAKWADQHFYPGHIAKEYPQLGKYEVHFDDGNKKTVSGNELFLVSLLEADQEVLAMDDDDVFNLAIIKKVYEDEKKYDVQFVVDNSEKCCSMSEIMLSSTQALPLRPSGSELVTISSTPQPGDISLENLVIGKRSRGVVSSTKKSGNLTGTGGKRRKTADSAVKPKPSDPEPSRKRKASGDSKESKKRLFEEDLTATPSSKKPDVNLLASPRIENVVDSPIATRPLPKEDFVYPEVTKEMENFLKDYVFLVTHLDRKEDKPPSSTPTTPCSSNEWSREYQCNIPFDRTAVEELIYKCGGVIINEYKDRAASTASNCVLISSSYQRTLKYIHCLAADVPCVSHVWLVDSIKQGKPLEYEPYYLPAGICIETDMLIERNLGRQPLKGQRLCLSSANARFLSCWQSVLKASGSTVLEMPEKMEDLRDIDLVVCDDSMTGVLPPASMNIPTVRSEWIVQTLITSARRGFKNHPKYYIEET